MATPSSPRSWPGSWWRSGEGRRRRCGAAGRRRAVRCPRRGPAPDRSAAGGTIAMLQVAAVIGRDVELDLLTAASGGAIDTVLDAIEPAVVHRLLAPVPERPATFRFSHALVREVVADDVSALRRARIHLSVADALESTAGDLDDAAEIIAEHLWAAAAIGVGQRATEALERAATVAVRRYALEAAEGMLERAVQLRRRAGTTSPDIEAEVVSTRQPAVDPAVRPRACQHRRFAPPAAGEGAGGARRSGGHPCPTAVGRGRTTRCDFDRSDAIAQELHRLGARGDEPLAGSPGWHPWASAAGTVDTWARRAPCSMTPARRRRTRPCRRRPLGSTSRWCSCRTPSPATCTCSPATWTRWPGRPSSRRWRRPRPLRGVAGADVRQCRRGHHRTARMGRTGGSPGNRCRPRGHVQLLGPGAPRLPGGGADPAGPGRRGPVDDRRGDRPLHRGRRADRRRRLQGGPSRGLAAAGRIDAAVDAVAAAYRELEVYGERFAEPLVLEADASLRHARSDDPAEVAGVMTAAIALAAEQGSHAIARRIAATAQRLGVSTG